ncbi:uncharacterized protein LOC143850967 isoform X2 [Tasmannia lanceolata]|uniref:uncharacterized protein LOC143850967 isoform X2 n=1 Tax=Tasmannia lanceolata TaxID=3420 RepID=UPI0040643E86
MENLVAVVVTVALLIWGVCFLFSLLIWGVQGLFSLLRKRRNSAVTVALLICWGLGGENKVANLGGVVAVVVLLIWAVCFLFSLLIWGVQSLFSLLRKLRNSAVVTNFHRNVLAEMGGSESKMKDSERDEWELSDHVYSAQSNIQFSSPSLDLHSDFKCQKEAKGNSAPTSKWEKPEPGTTKLNTNAACLKEANSISAPTSKWEKPESGTIKLNTDGAPGRIGGLLRDSSGKVTSFFSMKTEFKDSDLFEMQAIKVGLLQATREKIQRLWVESDHESSVDLINGHSNSSGQKSGERKVLLKEICDLLREFEWTKVTHSKKSGKWSS